MSISGGEETRFDQREASSRLSTGTSPTENALYVENQVSELASKGLRLASEAACHNLRNSNNLLDSCIFVESFAKAIFWDKEYLTSAGDLRFEPRILHHQEDGPVGECDTVVWADRGTANPNATPDCYVTPRYCGEAPNHDPCNAGPGSDLSVYRSDSYDGGASWTGRTLLDDVGGASRWFVWSDYKSDGTLVAAWDEDTARNQASLTAMCPRAASCQPWGNTLFSLSSDVTEEANGQRH